MSPELAKAGLVALQFTAAFLFGALFYWLFRKLRARFQSRIGPPIYQPIADVVKLLTKETVIPISASRAWFVMAPLLALAGYVAAVALTPLGVEAPLSVIGDVLVVLIALVIPGAAVVIAGSSSGSPYGAIGASRELALLVASEIPFVASALAIVKAAGGLSFQAIIEAQASCPFIVKYPFAAIAFLMALMLKLGRKPFDIPDAEVEVVAGPFTEYSGSLLGIFELGGVLKWMVLPALFVNLFLAGGRLTESSPLDFAVFLALCGAVVFVASLIDAQSSRLRVDQAFKLLLSWGVALALVDLVRAATGWLAW
ncbi:MAG: NADH-quinone oxidoreductase subunit H [Candidatus Nezhaarchaeota archaeon]|nr:NADH-quinone oxidoreductase subunit H [Candidatus Nezhaarchaeota archaeon]